jgi:cytochrome c
MKKVLLTMIVAAGLYACGGGENKETAETKPISNASTEESEKKVEAAPVAKKDGKALIEGSDCRTCHKDDTKLIGPAYKDVAKKYENNDENVKKLAAKVMKGGQGVWGEIPMAPHPALSSEDAEAMVSYILSMNK